MKFFEMFSGFGGASFALKKAGIDFECIGISETDKYAIQCFNQNFPNIKNFGDCTKINPNDLPDFDLLTGGFPCQSFSVAGKGLGEQDTRGTLFYDIIRIAEVKKPTYMLLENVKGLTNKKHKDTFNKILSELKRIGYDVKWKVLNSKEYGIPQNRERIFFVCKLGGWEFMEFIFPEKEELKIFLKDILEKEVDEKYYLSEEQTKKLLMPKTSYCIDANYHKGTNLKGYLEKKRRQIVQVGMINQTCKKRTFETPKEINEYLKKEKGNKTIQEIADYLNIPKTQVEHYFRTDNSRAIPSPEIWIKLKKYLMFNNKFDKEVLDIYEKEIEFESSRRVYSDSGCSPTISSTNADKIIQLNPSKESHNQQPFMQNRVYDSKGINPAVCSVQPNILQVNNPTHSNNRIYSDKGISPTLNSMGGGDRQPFIISSTQKHNSINNKGIMNCLPEAMGKDGGHTPMILSQPLKFLNRNQKNLQGEYSGCIDSSNTNGIRIIHNCLTEAIGRSGSSSEYKNSINKRYESNSQIRKLTPREAFRLMGFLNDEIDLSNLSNTQKYKLAGNGFEINVVSKIFKQMFK